MTAQAAPPPAAPPRAAPPRRVSAWTLGASAVALALLLAVPFMLSTVYVIVVTGALVAATLAVSFNLLYGYVGMLSFGLAGLFGAGAYATVLIVEHLGLPFVPAAFLASAIVALFGLVSGALLVSLPRIAFIMLTFVLADLLLFATRHLRDLTGSDNGIVLIVGDGLNIASHPENVYYLVLLLGGVAFAFSVLLVQSRSGTILKAIRENPERVASVGINVWRYRLLAFTASSWIAGMAGALGALESQLLFPTVFDWRTSADALIITLLGGVGTAVGPIIGAAVLFGINFFVGRETTNVVIVNGILLLIVVLIAPRGVVAFLVTSWERIKELATRGRRT
jgi:branched-chain amino acid transport system permease protein